MNLLQRTLIACALVSTSGAALAQNGTSVSSTSALSAARQIPTNATQTQGAVPHVFAPTMPRIAYSRYPWKTDIVGTVFWIGEDPSSGNPTPNHKSAWDVNWASNYGGVDTPDATKRTVNFTPTGFVPKLNPFYIALPYNDVIDSSHTKPSAALKIPWYKQRFTRQGKSIVKDQWLAIRFGMKVCYAQWEDVGPFETDDVDYVFGTARPKNKSNNGAGIDLAPAVRDYLGLKSGSKVDWRFVDLNEIPDGPWRWFGTNNQFVNARSNEKAVLNARIEELRRMRDEYFKQNGNSAFRAR
jgi:hypothetical protein